MSRRPSNPVSVQATSGNAALYNFDQPWHTPLFGSFKECPNSAFACCCYPCYAAQLLDRSDEFFLSCLVSPCSMMALRAKIRTAFHIRGSVLNDCLTTTCCVCQCAAMQMNKELTHRGIAEKRAPKPT